MIAKAEAERSKNVLQVEKSLSEQQAKFEAEQWEIYKQTLLYQQAMREKHLNNYGKMTKEEKNLNKMDLHAFRNKEANMYSMVPGINNFNTVGT